MALSASTDSYQLQQIAGGAAANVQVWAIYADGTRKDVTKKVRWEPGQKGLLKIKNGRVAGGGAPGSTPVVVSYGGQTDTLNFGVGNTK